MEILPLLSSQLIYINIGRAKPRNLSILYNTYAEKIHAKLWKIKQLIFHCKAFNNQRKEKIFPAMFV